MNKHIKPITLILIALLLCSCSIAHYEIVNELPSNQSHTHTEECNISYFLIFTSGSYTNTFGSKKDTDERTLKLQNKYQESIENVLKNKGCKITQASNQNQANFIIEVKRQLSRSALPQEWLTGLSFGLIPSWGTRPEQFIYKFEDKRRKTKHSYAIDQQSYNHLVLFPVFWVTFFILDEFNVFEETFNNFIENS